VTAEQHEFAAIVLAADRGPSDPVALAAGVPAKCLATIAGTPMVVRVLRGLAQSGRVGPVLISVAGGQPLALAPGSLPPTTNAQVRWIRSEASPSRSAAAALAALPTDRPVLLTTGDHPLLSPQMVRHFVDHAAADGADLAVGLAPYELVQAAHPRTRRTVLRFSDGRFCGCNLFAFLTPRSRAAAEIWKEVEAQRKRPVRVVGLVGWGAMALYAMGRLSLKAVGERFEQRTGLRVRVVTMPFAEAAIDVDTADDLELVRRITQAGD
jgi:CTP:molybdopterin cytidylyltransferase MocA